MQNSKTKNKENKPNLLYVGIYYKHGKPNGFGMQLLKENWKKVNPNINWEEFISSIVKDTDNEYNKSKGNGTLDQFISFCFAKLEEVNQLNIKSTVEIHMAIGMLHILE